MIDNQLLEELVTFARVKTLAKTAEELHLTQPSVTRGMQRLEEELGVTLFDRQPNRISLTATGELAAEKAAAVLAANRELVQQVRDFAASQTTTRVAVTAPGPLNVLQGLVQQHRVEVAAGFLNPAEIEDQLLDYELSLVISHEEVQTDAVESLFLGQEQLQVNLDPFTYQANQKAVTFANLAGMSFIVLDAIGPWKQIIEQEVPEAKFIYQADQAGLREITKYSNFPYFTSTLTQGAAQRDLNPESRVCLPITDEAATMTFYATYRQTDRRRLQPLLKQLQQTWQEVSQ